MAFQWVFDNAATIAVNKRQVVTQTETRNETVRAVSRGTAVKKFTVMMPVGMQWSANQASINAVDVADRFTVENIIFDLTNMAWMESTAIGDNDTYDIICTSLPQWTITDIDVVQWSGAFQFQEVLRIVIFTQPANDTSSSGAASFTLTTGVIVPASYQWEYSTDGGTVWATATGTIGNITYTNDTTATLTLAGVTAGEDAYQYRVVMTDTNGPDVTSDGAAILTFGS